MRNLRFYAGLLHGRDGISPAYNRNGRGIRDGVGDGYGAFRELGNFKNAHGPVPYDGLGLGNQGSVGRARGRPDIQAHPVGGNAACADHFRRGVGVELFRHDVVPG